MSISASFFFNLFPYHICKYPSSVCRLLISRYYCCALKHEKFFNYVAFDFESQRVALRINTNPFNQINLEHMIKLHSHYFLTDPRKRTPRILILCLRQWYLIRNHIRNWNSVSRFYSSNCL